MGYFSGDGFSEEVSDYSHAGDGFELMEKIGCGSGNEFVWDGLCERYMSENVKVAEPAETSQLLVLQIVSVIRPRGDAGYCIAANL